MVKNAGSISYSLGDLLQGSEPLHLSLPTDDIGIMRAAAWDE